MIKTDSGYEATATWTTTNNLSVTVTASLTTKKTADLDGDKFETTCCVKNIVARIGGMGVAGYGVETFKAPVTSKNGSVMVGCIGKLGLTAENMAAVKAIVAEIESAPEWVAKKEKEAASMAAYVADMEAKRANGYCFKCHSYCHGDCEAN